MLFFIYATSQDGKIFIRNSTKKTGNVSFITTWYSIGALAVALGRILTLQIANKAILIGIRPAAQRLLSEGGIEGGKGIEGSE